MYLKCRVLQQAKVGAEAFALDLDVQDMAGLSRPGQFVMLRCWEGDDPFLMRPFSINSVDRKNGIMTLLYQVRGRGTSLMSALRPTDSVAVLGPLGRGFPVREGASRVALIFCWRRTTQPMARSCTSTSPQGARRACSTDRSLSALGPG